MTDQPQSSDKAKKSGRRLRRLLLPTAFLLAAAVLVLPGLLLEAMLNREEPEGDSFFSAVATEDVGYSAFSTTLTLGGVTLTPRSEPGSPVTIGRATVAGLRRWKFLKAVLGFGDEDLVAVLTEGELVVRGLASDGLRELGLKSLRLSSASARGVRIPAGEGVFLDVRRIGLDSLRLAGLDVSLSDGGRLEADALSLFGLSDAVVGRLVLGGAVLELPGGGPVGGAGLSGASLSRLDLASLIVETRRASSARETGDTLALVQSLLGVSGSVGNFDLGSLTVGDRGGAEILRLGRAVSDEAPDDDLARIFTVDGLEIDLAALRDRWPEDPLAEAFLAGLPPRARLSLLARTGPAPAESPPAPAPAAADASAGNGPGATGQGGTDDPLPRAPRSAPSRRHEVGLVADDAFELSLTALSSGLSGGGSSPLAMLAGLTGLSLGPGEIKLTDRGFLGRFFPQLSEKVLGGRAAEKVILDALPSVLESLDDPDDRTVNAGVIGLEAAGFLAAPRSLALAWEPEENYPGSVLSRIDGGLFSALASAPDDFGGLADKYKHAMIYGLNLTLQVNGRAPVAVSLRPPPGR
ncbi:MAG: hypothetical protein LBO05_14075 [Deltaproteobacteria bacterium]|jgi:hypothetical protein|nr:hypothetical protein [Deltaproteobacteria bacterium]